MGGVDVASVLGLAVQRITDLHPGNASPDVGDAFIIADAARALLTPCIRRSG